MHMIIATMSLSPSQEQEQEQERELRVPFYNVGTETFVFPERRGSSNMEHGNGNVGHVLVPRLPCT
jgi:hypothetical protein